MSEAKTDGREGSLEKMRLEMGECLRILLKQKQLKISAKASERGKKYTADDVIAELSRWDHLRDPFEEFMREDTPDSLQKFIDEVNKTVMEIDEIELRMHTPKNAKKVNNELVKLVREGLRNSEAGESSSEGVEGVAEESRSRVASALKSGDDSPSDSAEATTALRSITNDELTQILGDEHAQLLIAKISTTKQRKDLAALVDFPDGRHDPAGFATLRFSLGLGDKAHMLIEAFKNYRGKSSESEGKEKQVLIGETHAEAGGALSKTVVEESSEGKEDEDLCKDPELRQVITKLIGDVPEGTPLVTTQVEKELMDALLSKEDVSFVKRRWLLRQLVENISKRIKHKEVKIGSAIKKIGELPGKEGGTIEWLQKECQIPVTASLTTPAPETAVAEESPDTPDDPIAALRAEVPDECHDLFDFVHNVANQWNTAFTPLESLSGTKKVEFIGALTKASTTANSIPWTIAIEAENADVEKEKKNKFESVCQILELQEYIDEIIKNAHMWKEDHNVEDLSIMDSVAGLYSGASETEISPEELKQRMQSETMSYMKRGVLKLYEDDQNGIPREIHDRRVWNDATEKLAQAERPLEYFRQHVLKSDDVYGYLIMISGMQVTVDSGRRVAFIYRENAENPTPPPPPPPPSPGTRLGNVEVEEDDLAKQMRADLHALEGGNDESERESNEQIADLIRKVVPNDAVIQEMEGLDLYHQIDEFAQNLRYNLDDLIAEDKVLECIEDIVRRLHEAGLININPESAQIEAWIVAAYNDTNNPYLTAMKEALEEERVHPLSIIEGDEEVLDRGNFRSVGSLFGFSGELSDELRENMYGRIQTKYGRQLFELISLYANDLRHAGSDISGMRRNKKMELIQRLSQSVHGPGSVYRRFLANAASLSLRNDLWELCQYIPGLENHLDQIIERVHADREGLAGKIHMEDDGRLPVFWKNILRLHPEFEWDDGEPVEMTEIEDTESSDDVEHEPSPHLEEFKAIIRHILHFDEDEPLATSDVELSNEYDLIIRFGTRNGTYDLDLVRDKLADVLTDMSARVSEGDIRESLSTYRPAHDESGVYDILCQAYGAEQQEEDFETLLWRETQEVRDIAELVQAVFLPSDGFDPEEYGADQSEQVIAIFRNQVDEAHRLETYDQCIAWLGRIYQQLRNGPVPSLRGLSKKNFPPVLRERIKNSDVKSDLKARIHAAILEHEMNGRSDATEDSSESPTYIEAVSELPREGQELAIVLGNSLETSDGFNPYDPSAPWTVDQVRRVIEILEREAQREPRSGNEDAYRDWIRDLMVMIKGVVPQIRLTGLADKIVDKVRTMHNPGNQLVGRMQQAMVSGDSDDEEVVDAEIVDDEVIEEGVEIEPTPLQITRRVRNGRQNRRIEQSAPAPSSPEDAKKRLRDTSKRVRSDLFDHIFRKSLDDGDRED